ncbi:hypothetical protein ACFDR9_002810 [Janthinobacterium sp. CG_23.3]
MSPTVGQRNVLRAPVRHPDLIHQYAFVNQHIRKGYRVHPWTKLRPSGNAATSWPFSSVTITRVFITGTYDATEEAQTQYCYALQFHAGPTRLAKRP